MALVIHWFRRDLRLSDNTALAEALKAGEVLGVFVLDPGILKRKDTGAARLDFLYAALGDLDRELRRRGSQLLLRRGAPEAVLGAVARQSGATACFFNRDYEPYAIARDARVTEVLHAQGLSVHSYKDDVMVEAGELPGPRPARVFTPYYRAWLAAISLAALTPRSLQGRFVGASAVSSQPIPGPGASAAGLRRAAAGGRAAAVSDLERFAAGPIQAYAADRDRLDRPATSRISPYLRFGLVSIRECLRLARRTGGAGSEAWERQLAWRDFYRQLLIAMPRLEAGPMDDRMAGLAWNDDPAALLAWREGRTGYPVVDAAMRQLAAEGWLPNRARLIVASFLVKDLGVNWQAGERVFMERLLDGDLANNNGGWQWVAGTGTDAQPFFRVFNPVLQGRRFDPEGVYVRRWCPELEGVPASTIHAPWSLNESEQRRSGCLLGRDYPRPIVDHQQARQLALARFNAVRSRAAASVAGPRSRAGSSPSPGV